MLWINIDYIVVHWVHVPHFISIAYFITFMNVFGFFPFPNRDNGVNGTYHPPPPHTQQINDSGNNGA